MIDIIYRNSMRTTDTSVCNAPEQQLRQATPEVLEVGSADAVVSFKACQDKTGVRGLVFYTLTGRTLSCGDTDGHCQAFSSRSIYPLHGLWASCAADGATDSWNSAHNKHADQQQQQQYYPPPWNANAAGQQLYITWPLYGPVGSPAEQYAQLQSTELDSYYPGQQALEQLQNHAGQVHSRHKQRYTNGFVRVHSITSACWQPEQQAPIAGA